MNTNDINIICELYVSGLTTREVAEKVNYSKTTIATIIKEYGISRPKTIRQEVLDSKVKHCKSFSKEFVDYIDGLILSDAFLQREFIKTKTSALTQNSVQENWLKDIQSEFLKFEINSSVVPEKRKKKRPKTCFVLNTNRYSNFYLHRKRWYNEDGKKIIPKDINLKSKTLLKNWIYGDGTLLGKSTLRFCTDDFIISDINWLIEYFEVLGFKFQKTSMGFNSKNIEKWRLSLCCRDGLKDFYDYVGQPEFYFNYKWIQ